LSFARTVEVREIGRKAEPGRIISFIIIAISSVLVSGILILTDGNMEAGVAFIMMVAIIFISFYRVDWAFFIFFALVLLFDQFIVLPNGSNPITHSVGYFDNVKGISYLPHFAAGVMNPIEIQLFLMSLGWFIAVASSNKTKTQHVVLWGLAILLIITFCFSLIYGLARGGDFLVSLWEVRAVFYFLILYFFVPQIIQTRQQLGILLWIMIIAVSIKALQGTATYIQLGFSLGGEDTSLTNHEDPVFIVDLWILLISFLTLKVKSKNRTSLLLLLLPLFTGFYAGNRRAAYGAFIGGLIVFILMLRSKERWRFFRVFFPILFVLGCYTAAFWNRPGRLGMPVQSIKSGILPNDEAYAGDRYSSNLYREIERYDLAATVRSFPIIGVGFGNEYLQPIGLVKLSGWTLQDWIAHDEILWLLANMGAIGFFIFFLFIDALLFEAATIHRSLDDPYLRSLTIMIAAAIVGQIIVSYYDLQLTYYRNMILLGTLCGLLPTIKSLNDKERKETNQERIPVLTDIAT